MTAQSLLMSLRERGIALALVAGGVKVTPASALTPEELAELKAQRDELIALLEGEAEGVIRLELVPAAQFAEEMAGCEVTDHTGRSIALPNVGRRPVRSAVDVAPAVPTLRIAKPAPLAAVRDVPRVGTPAEHLAAIGGRAAVEAIAGLQVGYRLALLVELFARDGPGSTWALDYWDAVERWTT